MDIESLRSAAQQHKQQIFANAPSTGAAKGFGSSAILDRNFNLKGAPGRKGPTRTEQHYEGGQFEPSVANLALWEGEVEREIDRTGANEEVGGDLCDSKDVGRQFKNTHQ